MKIIEDLFSNYGYFVLLIGLPLELIALPIPPGNTTLAYTGYLSYKNVLHLLPAFGAAYTGSVLGITTTYWIGNKLGMPLVEKYGKWIFLKPRTLHKTKQAYEKYGVKILLFGFFLPGVRQFNSYFAGIMQIPYRTFALYAYTGLALWVSLFIGVGYIFGNQWQFVFVWIEQSLKYILIALCCLVALFVVVKQSKRRAQGQS